MPHKKAVGKLKSRWGVESTLSVVVIFIVFSLAGTSILYVKTPVFNALHIPLDISLWIKIPIVLLMYQVLLLVWGTLLGHFRFFWEKEKKMFGWLIRPFKRRSRISDQTKPRKKTSCTDSVAS